MVVRKAEQGSNCAARVARFSRSVIDVSTESLNKIDDQPAMCWRELRPDCDEPGKVILCHDGPRVWCIFCAAGVRRIRNTLRIQHLRFGIVIIANVNVVGSNPITRFVELPCNEAQVVELSAGCALALLRR